MNALKIIHAHHPYGIMPKKPMITNTSNIAPIDNDMTADTYANFDSIINNISVNTKSSNPFIIPLYMPQFFYVCSVYHHRDLNPSSRRERAMS